MGNLSTEAMREYMANRRRARQQQLRALLGNKCVHCGRGDDLQFDHIDPETKLFAISGRSLDLPWRRLLIEIEKCQLLCFWCHVEKSKKDIKDINAKRRRHGSYSKYIQDGCRCEDCVTYYKAARRRWRNKGSAPEMEGRSGL